MVSFVPLARRSNTSLTLSVKVLRQKVMQGETATEPSGAG